MKNKTEVLLLTGLVALFILSLFHRLDFSHLKFEEPRRALVSLEMIRSGNWLQPSIYGLPYFNKPPVYNWVLAVFMKVLGTADWVIRLPTVLSMLLIGLFNYRFWKPKIGKQASLWSSIFFVTSVNIYFYFSFQGEIDMFYSLIIFLQVLSIFHYYERKAYWHLFLVSYLLTAIGFLTKGVPSIGFQGLTLIGMMLYYRQFKWFFSLQHVVAGLLSVGIMASFFIAYMINGGQTELYLSKIFFEGARRTVNHQQSFSFLSSFASFIPLFLYLLSPWVILSLFGINKSRIIKLRQNKWLTFALIFLLFNLPLYWFSAGTRDRYLYMFLPFCMVWLSPLVLNGLEKKSFRVTTSIFIAILGIASLAALTTPVGSLPHAQPVLIGFSVFALVTSVFGYIKRTHQLLSWFAVLIALRFVFNMIVLEQRKQEEYSASFPAIVDEIRSYTQQGPIYYYAPFQLEEVPLPVLDQTVTFREVPRLDYTFTYYLNRTIIKTIQHSDVISQGSIIIMEPHNLIQAKTNQVLMEFDLGNKRYLLVKT
jgi:4-amino-4-deoxy-L-arabinose transferase-like glycosyltransferase